MAVGRACGHNPRLRRRPAPLTRGDTHVTPTRPPVARARAACLPGPPTMSGFAEYDAYDGLGLAALVAAGEISAADLLEEAVARCARVNPLINAVVEPMAEHARARLAAGTPTGPFGGVPFLMKDLGSAVAGVPLRNGSRYFRDFVPSYDNEMVQRLHAAAWSPSARPIRPNSAWSARPSRACSGRRAIRGISRAHRAARVAVRRPRSRPGSCPWPVPATAAAPSAFRPPVPGWSASNPRVAATPRVPNSARAGTDRYNKGSSRAACATPRPRSMPPRAATRACFIAPRRRRCASSTKRCANRAPCVSPCAARRCAARPRSRPIA